MGVLSLESDTIAQEMVRGDGGVQSVLTVVDCFFFTFPVTFSLIYLTNAQLT